jgi:hypothetical protein
LLYTFLVVFIAAGLVLFGPTRGDFGRPDELEAEAYEPALSEPDVPDEPDQAPDMPDAAGYEPKPAVSKPG